MKLEINVPDVCYENILNGEMDSLDVRYGLEAIKKGTQLPEGAEILTAEAYSDLCLLASRSIEWHPYPQEKPTSEGERYLITALRGGERQVCTAWWADEDCFGVFTDRVTAWAELPKPYEEGAEE